MQVVVGTSERGWDSDSSQTRIVLGDLATLKRSPSIQVWEGIHEEELRCC